MKAFVTRRKRLGSAIAVLVVTASAIAAVSVSGAQARSDADELKGAGSTFLAPLITAWQQKYEAAKGVKVTYNPIGSGGGIPAITNKTVDFGASDAPMTTDQFNACGGCVQLPWALSATSVMYNLPGAEQPAHHRADPGRHLSRQDQEVERPAAQGRQQGRQPSRPRTSRPSTGATPAARRTTSPTYLNTVSPQWKSQVGRRHEVNWPTGVGARGSSGVAGVLTRTEGAIGYADIAYALKNHLKFFSVQNRVRQLRAARSRGNQGRVTGRPEVQPRRTSCRS